MRNSEDFSGEPDYQAINSRLIGKPVLSSYLNAREYTPKYEDDEVGQREGYSGGTDYQALNSRLIGKPVRSSYLSGGRYFPASAGDRAEYIKELLANQEYFRTLADKMKNRDPKDPNAEKLIQGESAAFAGFYPAKMPENDKEQEKWDAEWEKRKASYLYYLDLPTRAYFFPKMTKEQVLSVDEIPRPLERLMRYPYFRATASLLGEYLNKEGYVTFPNNEMVVSDKWFGEAALNDFLKRYYYPHAANWTRQVISGTKVKMEQARQEQEEKGISDKPINREKILNQVKDEIKRRVTLSPSKAAAAAQAAAAAEAAEAVAAAAAAKKEALAAAEKKEKKIADEINSIIAKLEEKSIEYEDKTVRDLSQHFFKAVERNSIPGTWSNSDKPLREFRNAVKVEGLDSPRGKAYSAIEKAMVNLLRYDLVTDILQNVDKKTARIFWHVVIGQRGKPETFIKRLRYPLRGTREPVKYTADDVEEKLKLKEKIREKAAEAAKPKEIKVKIKGFEKNEGAAKTKEIKNLKVKIKGFAKNEETTDGEEPASEKATTRKTKKGSAATKREASSTTGTKSRPKVGSAALGSKTTKTSRKKGAKSPPTSTPELPANGVRTTPTKKGTRNKNPASTSDTLPVAVSPPAPKVRGKKSASPGNKKRVTPGKKKSVLTSAALPPPPAEETSSPAVPPTEEGRGKKRAGTPPSAAPPRKRRTRGANPTARSYDLRERKNVSYD